MVPPICLSGYLDGADDGSHLGTSVYVKLRGLGMNICGFEFPNRLAASPSAGETAALFHDTAARFCRSGLD